MKQLKDLEIIVINALNSFKKTTNINDLEYEKARFFGKSGIFSNFFKELNLLDLNIRKTEYKRINIAKKKIELALLERRKYFSNKLVEYSINTGKIDITLPGRGLGIGCFHPVIKTLERVEEIFRSIGFDIIDGPEIETEWYNFTALNSPENHPARSMHDTFYLDKKDNQGKNLLLRTHTSSMQIRYAHMHPNPPIKVIVIGKVYRIDNDITHSPMFHQIEGLWIDKNINLSHLKGIYTNFLENFFRSKNIALRFRPSYFPFTEPSVEIDIMFSKSKNKKQQWLEISGAGQVHPKVMSNMGINPKKYSGFAFGSGAERLTMLRYNINDVRLFFENDLRFLSQFT